MTAPPEDTPRARDDVAARWVHVSTLTAWASNPRQNDAAVAPVADSLKRFGWGAPILAREANGEVVAGHTRLRAVELLATLVTTATDLDGWHPEALRSAREGIVPVRFGEWSERDAHLLALADNRLNELAEWDAAKLSEVMSGYSLPEVETAGWTSDDLEAMAAGLGADGAGEGGEGDAPDAAPDNPGDDRPSEKPPAITKAGEDFHVGRHRLVCADCIDVLKALPDCSVDSIVTDPPYGIGFMGKGWDVSVPGAEWAEQCLRVLKPGGHLIAFAATRTVHRLTTIVEDAGFEIRDMISWLQWQGFPKSMDVSKAIDAAAGAEREVVGQGGSNCPDIAKGKPCGCAERYGAERSQSGGTAHAPATAPAKQWDGWGTALKPSQEPAVMARKPLSGTVAETVVEHGTGGLNIDGCRYPAGDAAWPGPQGELEAHDVKASDARGTAQSGSVDGRFPANIYVCPKPARSEREDGTEDLEKQVKSQLAGAAGGSTDPVSERFRSKPMGNIHPTVKPVRLMRWLVRLVTPPGGTVLEPFLGSGTTLVACEREGFNGIGVEASPEYMDICRARVAHAVEGDSRD